MTRTLEHEAEGLEHQFMRNHVHIMHGTARFLDQHRVEVTADTGDTHLLRGSRIVIAVGTRPYRPDNVPFDGTKAVDSDGIITLQKLPNSLAVVGVEYATIFSALDVRVTLIEPRDSFLDFVDRELMGEFIHQLRDRGVSFRLGDAVE